MFEIRRKLFIIQLETKVKYIDTKQSNKRNN